MDENNLRTILIETVGPMGRMISASKSGYRERNPENIAVFNSNLVLLEAGEKFGLETRHGKVWFGDIDVTKDRNQLKDLAKRSGCDVVILSEMDGRFENEKDPLLDRFIYRVSPSGTETLGRDWSERYDIVELKRKK